MNRLTRVLEARAEEILQRWSERVRQPLASGGARRPALQEALPLLLRRLITTLGNESHEDRTSPETGRAPGRREPDAWHLPPDFSLGEVVREYDLLREVLLDLVEEEDVSISLREVRRLIQFMATAITEAVEAHAQRSEQLFRDGNERRLRAETELERARLHTLIEQAPAAIAVLRGPALVFETLNAETARVWGRPLEQLRGRPLLEVLPELREQGFDALLHGVMTTGKPYIGTEVPVPVQRPTGEVETCFFNFTYAPWRNEAESALGVVVLAMEVTEAVRARREAQAERERAERARTAVLDALVAQSLVGVAYLHGSEHLFERLNPLHDQMLDRDVLGQTVQQAFPDMEDQGFRMLLDQVFQTGQPFMAREVPVRLGAGRSQTPRELRCDFTYQPVRAPDGGSEGILALVVDVTEQTRLRTRAEGERARLNALFQQAPVAIGILRGPEIVIEVANPPLCRIWGRPQAQVVGLPAMDALPELRGLGLDELVREVMATGKSFVATEMEVHFPRGPGGELNSGYYNFVYDALRDERGVIEGVLLTAIEVTENILARRKMQALLTESQRVEREGASVLDALAHQALVGVAYLKGSEHVFETANPLFLRFAGREVVGQRVQEVFPGPEYAGIVSPLGRVFETGEPFMVREAPLRPRPGEVSSAPDGLFDVAYQPVRALDGSLDGVLFLVFEVTEQVRLRQSAERLAHEERARRDFEQHLIGIVSHDLRNPLGAILLGLQVLLRREGLDARTMQSLVRLHASTERAVRMVRDLLDFTQARLGGGLKIERTSLDMLELVRGVVEEFRLTHAERELRLEQHGDGRGQWDADRLTQLLGNLVSNALKYSPPETPITVRTRAEEDALWLEVHNLGEPIAPEALPRLFQPLQRAVAGIDKAGRSVGLGLYIVEQIARAHGGDIQVRSSALEGTRFTVRLPRSS